MTDKVIPIVATRACGPCSLCCKVLSVRSIGKARNVWCEHAKPGRGGCSIYASEAFPSDCGAFLCAWVSLPGTDPIALPESFRPDKLHAFITGVKSRDGSGYSYAEGIIVHCDPGYPEVWREEPLRSLLGKLIAKGLRVVVASGNKRHLLLKQGTPAATFLARELGVE